MERMTQEQCEALDEGDLDKQEGQPQGEEVAGDPQLGSGAAEPRRRIARGRRMRISDRSVACTKVATRIK
jgi:hypothetical protein